MSTENEANVDSSDAITLEEAGPDSTSGTFEVAEGSKVKKPLYATPVDKEEQMREAQERIEADARAGFDKMVYTDEDSSIRQTLFVVLDEPDSGLVARLISVVMMLLILWSSTSLVIETVKEVKEKTELVTLLHIMEVIAVLVFTVEYLVRMACCTDRPGESKGFFSYLFAPMNLIDLMSVLPFYIELMVGKNGSGFEVLRLLRMARVFRVMKLGSYAKELQLFVKGYNRSREGLTLLMFMLLLYLCVFGTFLWMAEFDAHQDAFKAGDTSNPGFTSIPTTWYFIMATMTTVGYGDHYPYTWYGKIICTCTMFCGILVLALPIMIIGNSFEEVFTEEVQQKADADKKSARAAAMEKLDNPLVDDGSPVSPRTRALRALDVDKKVAVHTVQHLLQALYEETHDTRFERASAILLE